MPHLSASLAAAVAALVLPAAALAQTPAPIGPGQTVSGVLEDGDAVLGDGSLYDAWVYQGRQGERLTIVMRSDAFDTYLAAGRGQGADCVECRTDDDGAGGTDSRLVVALPQDGDYVIRANSLGADGRGSYTLSVESDGGAAFRAGPPPVRDIAVGGPEVAGELDPADALHEDGSWFEDYRFSARAGQRLRASMRSGDFDSFLAWGPAGEWEQLGADDDGGDGTDARLDFEIPADGDYVLRANSLSAGESGAFTLALVERAPPPPLVPLRTRVGAAEAGRLDETDALAEDESFFDEYRFGGVAGQRLRATMSSADFDTFLAWGTRVGGEWRQLGSNDDAEGTNSAIDFVLPSDGEYVLRANSLSPGESGAYVLTLTDRGPERPRQRPALLRVGGSVQGELDDADPTAEDNSRYDEYRFRAAAGERLRATMSSADFDAYLVWGSWTEAGWTPIGSNDDGAHGTDSDLAIDVETAGEYVLRANSLSPGQSGRYRVALERR